MYSSQNYVPVHPSVLSVDNWQYRAKKKAYLIEVVDTCILQYHGDQGNCLILAMYFFPNMAQAVIVINLLYMYSISFTDLKLYKEIHVKTPVSVEFENVVVFFCSETRIKKPPC